MNLDVKKFARKPFYVNAVQVTAENIVDVSLWCNGTVMFDETAYVKVEVRRPLNERQTRAYEGDWVLRAGQGFRVYNDTAFQKSFDELAIDVDLIEAIKQSAVDEYVDAVVKSQAGVANSINDPKPPVTPISPAQLAALQEKFAKK